MTNPADNLLVPDQRPDAFGNVTLAMPLEEFEAFIGMLNRAAMIMQRDGVGPYYALKFLPHYIGRGPVALEISDFMLDVCDGGWVCVKHPYDAPGHGGCDGERMPCGGALHVREFETAPKE